MKAQNRIFFGPYVLVPYEKNGQTHLGMWVFPGGGIVTTTQAYSIADKLGYKAETKIVMVRNRRMEEVFHHE